MMPLLFSYGTLQEASVQLATFGRRLSGTPDVLPGYAPSTVFSGGKTNANVVGTAAPGGGVAGTCLDVTESELAAADRFELPFDYVRIEVSLQSGRRAWVYTYRE